MRKPRILVVEDEALIALDICETLESAGAEIVGPAYNLTAGLELAEANDLDFAVLDLNLSGVKSTPIARQLNAAGTRFAWLSSVRRSELPEFDGSIAIDKPFNPDKLVGLVRKTCPQLMAS